MLEFWKEGVRYKVAYEDHEWWLYINGKRFKTLPESALGEHIFEIIQEMVCDECGGTGIVEHGQYDDITEEECPFCVEDKYNPELKE